MENPKENNEQIPKFYNKQKALDSAKNQSKEQNSVLFVIEAVEVNLSVPLTLVYFVDENGFLRNGEKIIATFECGTKIKNF